MLVKNSEQKISTKMPLIRCKCRRPELLASQVFFIVGGLYSVTALRKNDNERVTVYTEHRLPARLGEHLALHGPSNEIRERRTGHRISGMCPCRTTFVGLSKIKTSPTRIPCRARR